MNEGWKKSKYLVLAEELDNLSVEMPLAIFFPFQTKIDENNEFTSLAQANITWKRKLM